MGFISWLVVAALFMLAEFGLGTFYLLAIGLACLYPAYAAFIDASVGTQLTALSAGAILHVVLVMIFRKLKSSKSPSDTLTDIGQRVEVIQWLDECTALVMYNGKEWQADKAKGEMPDADHGIITSVQYGRLVISTEQTA